jgi:hypothetical protein
MTLTKEKHSDEGFSDNQSNQKKVENDDNAFFDDDFLSKNETYQTYLGFQKLQEEHKEN